MLKAKAAVAATSMSEMAVLRFITGIGLGGVFPTTISLLSESAPRRFRASCFRVDAQHPLRS